MTIVFSFAYLHPSFDRLRLHQMAGGNGVRGAIVLPTFTDTNLKKLFQIIKKFKQEEGINLALVLLGDRAYPPTDSRA